MKTIKIIFTTLLLLLSVASVYAQGRKISGKILSPLNKPIEGAIISAVGSKDAKTGVDGTFKMELRREYDSNFSVGSWLLSGNSLGR